MGNFTKREGIIILFFIMIILIGVIFNYATKDADEILITNTDMEEDMPKLDEALKETNDLDSADIEELDSNLVQEIVVDISGAVMNPGIVKLHEGDRVYNAIDLAGGLTSDADELLINRAKKVTDGEKIIIPKIGQDIVNQVNLVQSTGITNDGKVNINTSSINELKSLNGIGDVLAERIVEYRNTNNGYKAIEEIMKVSGIGEKKFEAIKNSIKLQ